MSLSRLNPDEIQSLSDLIAKLAAIEDSEACESIPDHLIAELLAASTTLYRYATHEGGRRIAAFPASSKIPATTVVVAVCAMLRAAGMNPFDLSMWFSRPHE